MPDLCERLKELRTNRNISQKKLTEELGISIRNYHRYEHGIVDPPISKITAIAEYFNVSLDYLVGRSDK